MSRQLILGNGNILISLDKHAQVRDFYFPFVGSENHINTTCIHKMGIWIDGRFSWLDSPGWEFSINYKKDTFASEITAKNNDLQVEIGFLDIVYNETNIFLRKIHIKNLSNTKRTIKFFFNQEFQIYETNRGNTAYYDPYDLYGQTIIHYKSRRVFLVSGRLKNKSFDDYSVGIIHIEGKEGTWKDAEDGTLSKNPIEHGSVDSTIAFTNATDANESYTFYYWITVGKTLEEAKSLHEYILKKTPDHLIESTQDFWHAWINKTELDTGKLNPKIGELFKKSLFIVRGHVDNRGGIIASSDSEILQYGRDTYAYIWPRDAVFAVIALDGAGYFDTTRRFFEFSNGILSKDGYFLHKYLPDGSLGSSWHPWSKDGQKQLPIQEDETALVLYAFYKHYELAKDLEFVEEVYNSLIKKSADFIYDFRDKETKLPFPSYDLWEQKFGISTFTAATVVAALNAAGNFAKVLGKEEDEQRYFTAAKDVKEAILKYLWNEEENFFRKLIEIKDGKILHDNTIDMSSFFAIFAFDILDADDERLLRAAKTVEEKLNCNTQIGGIVRYIGDNYYRVDQNLPGNPWFITTLWLAQYYIKIAKTEKDLEKAMKWIEWTLSKATPSGILSEQLHPHTGEPVSASPLTWSHAEFVNTVTQYLEKLKNFNQAA